MNSRINVSFSFTTWSVFILITTLAVVTMKTIFNNTLLLSIILVMLAIIYETNAREHNYRNSDNKIDSESQRDGKGEYEILLCI